VKDYAMETQCKHFVYLGRHSWKMSAEKGCQGGGCRIYSNTPGMPFKEETTFDGKLESRGCMGKAIGECLKCVVRQGCEGRISLK